MYQALLTLSGEKLESGLRTMVVFNGSYSPPVVNVHSGMNPYDPVHGHHVRNKLSNLFGKNGQGDSSDLLLSAQEETKLP